jgi:manganese oxidase
MATQPIHMPGNQAGLNGHAAHGRAPLSAGAAAGAESPPTGGHAGHGGHMGHGAGTAADPAAAVTPAQLAAVTLLTVLALVASVVFAASRANLRLSAHDVGGLVMPPGMLMGRETSAESMRDMAAVDLRRVAYSAPADARGDQPLAFRLDNGVKVFRLEAETIRWHILPNVQVAAYAFNRQVPGPRLRVTQGDRVRVEVTNRLPEATSVHWHGLILPNAMDGASEITQDPIPPGGRFVYEFTAGQPGTYFYHSHHHVDRQQTLGLYGALIVDPADAAARPAYDKELVVQLQEWTHKEGYTFPAMPMEGALPNYFTINGKAFPATETVHMKVGEKLLVRFVGSQGSFIHPMHIHGGPFTVVEADGYPVPPGAQLLKDTINVGPGERWDVVWEARAPGRWLVHCHINHHTTNDNSEQHGGGGLMLVIDVS